MSLQWREAGDPRPCYEASRRGRLGRMRGGRPFRYRGAAEEVMTFLVAECAVCSCDVRQRNRTAKLQSSWFSAGQGDPGASHHMTEVHLTAGTSPTVEA